MEEEDYKKGYNYYKKKYLALKNQMNSQSGGSSYKQRGGVLDEETKKEIGEVILEAMKKILEDPKYKNLVDLNKGLVEIQKVVDEMKGVKFSPGSVGELSEKVSKLDAQTKMLYQTIRAALLRMMGRQVRVRVPLVYSPIRY